MYAELENSSQPVSEQTIMRGLAAIWLDFETQLHNISIVRRVFAQQIRMSDYHELLRNHRAQVMNGSLWITRAASNIEHQYAELRARFVRHAEAEQHDYRMLEQDYLRSGGSAADLVSSELNIGSEALSAWMFQRASQPNPFDLLGAMYIIEGLGRHIAARWAEHIQAALKLPAEAVSFYVYHAKADVDHLGKLEEALSFLTPVLPALSPRILKTARVTARLYRLQLEEIGSY